MQEQSCLCDINLLAIKLSMNSQKAKGQLITIPEGNKLKDEVITAYKNLNNLIDQMNEKVEMVMEKHETQFVLAYHSHVTKIRKQLQILKKRADDQDREMKGNERAVYFEKQATIFRQESLKLYDRLETKTQESQHFKSKSKDLERTVLILQQELRENMKQRKIMDVKIISLQGRILQLQQDIKSKNDWIQKIREQNNQSKLKNSQNQINFKVRNSTKISSVTKNTSIGFRTKSISYVGLNRQSQLKQWFLQCVKTIKKQVATRKNDFKQLNFQTINNISEFKTLDKLKLLEKFMENEKLLVWMYEKIFPSRISQVRQYLSHRNLVNNETQASQTLPISQNNNTEKGTDNANTTQTQKIEVNLPKMDSCRDRSSKVRNKIQFRQGKMNYSHI